jgi:hypothetical protein
MVAESGGRNRVFIVDMLFVSNIVERVYSNVFVFQSVSSESCVSLIRNVV